MQLALVSIIRKDIWTVIVLALESRITEATNDKALPISAMNIPFFINYGPCTSESEIVLRAK